MISRATEALNRESLDAAHRQYADTPARKSWSKQANVLAVLLDVSPKDRQQAILRRVMAAKDHENTILEDTTVSPMSELSYYFRFYLNRALVHAGLGDVYLTQLTPWYNMLDLGLSTWAETPDPARSDCHAWSASPNYDLLSIVAGIQPGAPGFSRIKIAPNLSGLHQLTGSMPHVKGTIETSYQFNGSQWIATVTLPSGVEGEFEWKGKTMALHPGRQILNLP